MSDDKVESQIADSLWIEFAHTRDPRLRERIIHQFERLAYGIANRFTGRGMDEEDLTSVAFLGLVKAVDRFDPSRHYRFSTYAVPAIVGEIRHHFRDHYWLLHVPRGVQELAQHVKRAKLAMTAELGRSPHSWEIAARLQVSEERVVEAAALEKINHPVLIDEPVVVTCFGERATLEDAVGADDPDLHMVELGTGLRQALNHLPPRLEQIIRLRFLEGLSQRAVGRQVGLSQMQVSRLEQKALAGLRAELTPEEQERARDNRTRQAA